MNTRHASDIERYFEDLGYRLDIERPVRKLANAVGISINRGACVPVDLVNIDPVTRKPTRVIAPVGPSIVGRIACLLEPTLANGARDEFLLGGGHIEALVATTAAQMLTPGTPLVANASGFLIAATAGQRAVAELRQTVNPSFAGLAWVYFDSFAYFGYLAETIVSFNHTPASLGAGAFREDTIAVPGLTTSDIVAINPPSNNAVIIGQPRVPSADNIAIPYYNHTGGAVSPPAGAYKVRIIR